MVFPSLPFTLSFQFNHWDYLSISKWVSDVYPQAESLFALYDAAQGVTQNTENQALAYYARCISVMSLLFFKQANSPVFEPPQVMSIRGQPIDGNMVDFVFHLTNTGVVAGQLIKDVFSASIQMCTWLALQSAEGCEIKRSSLDYFQHLATTKLTGKNSNTPSAMKLLEGAHKASIPYCHLGKGVFRLGWGKNAVLFWASMAQTDSYCGMKLTGDKLCTAKLLSAAGVAVPVHKAVKSLPAAIQACKSLGFPVVIKPVDSERGEGVTVDLKDELSLAVAFEKAMQFSKAKSVLVERQVKGVCHRLFMVNGRLLYAVKRWPPSVFGDGVSSLKQLVEANVQHELSKLPFERYPLVPWDNETESFIREIGLTADFVPVALQRIPLRRIESTLWGGFDEEVTSLVHPDILRQARIACALVHMTVVGVDVITEDISKPLSETGGVINELNGGPSLGGAEISRSYIPEYLRRLVPHNGHIALQVFAEAELERAMQHFRQQIELGVQCYFVSDSLVIDHEGHKIPGKQASLTERLRTLLFNPDVGALCIVSDSLK
jgi:cyanophycin synthetase